MLLASALFCLVVQAVVRWNTTSAVHALEPSSSTRSAESARIDSMRLALPPTTPESRDERGQMLVDEGSAFLGKMGALALGLAAGVCGGFLCVTNSERHATVGESGTGGNQGPQALYLPTGRLPLLLILVHNLGHALNRPHARLLQAAQEAAHNVRRHLRFESRQCVCCKPRSVARVSRSSTCAYTSLSWSPVHPVRVRQSCQSSGCTASDVSTASATASIALSGLRRGRGEPPCSRGCRGVPD